MSYKGSKKAGTARRLDARKLEGWNSLKARCWKAEG